MLPSPVQFLCLATLCVVLVIFSRVRRPKKSNLPLPPGPRRLPVIGNVLDVPKKCEWVTFVEWGRRYDSGMVSFDIFGTSIIVINSFDTAHELLEKRSMIYSDRHPLPMLNDLMGFNWFLGMMPYGDAWKKRRTMLRQEFQGPALLKHKPHLLASVRALLRLLLQTPDNLLEHLRDTAGTFILATTYGITVQPENDPYVKIAREALHALACAGTPGAYLVDFIPSMKYIPHWFPGAKFQVQAREWRKSVTCMAELPFQFVKRSMAEGTAPSSIASRRLENISMVDGEEKADQERIIRDGLAAIYAGGSDTVVSALGTFFLAMVQNPDIQKKAQKAIDDVVGHDRLPDFTDSIPYVDAIVKEVNRWRPVLPLTGPHRVMEDDVIDGYRIPKHSLIVGNAWAMLNDKEIYPEPHVFRPERFLKDGKLDPNVRDPVVAFGFGRRFCPGMSMANMATWINAVSVLASFDILKAVDDNGVIIEPIEKYSSGLIRHPEPFKCVIRPRSREAESLIRATALENY